MNRSLKNICGRKYGGDKDEEIGKFFSSRKILTHFIFQLIIFFHLAKNFLIFPERHPEKCIFQ